jgi:hypothetical protein
MGRPVPYLLVAALGALTALAPASCGEEDAQLLPGETAREITANLDTVKQLSDEGDCIGAESAAQQVDEQVEALEEVDARLKQALEEGADRLGEVVAGCEEAPVETVSPRESPTEVEEIGKDEEKEQKREEKELEKEEKEREKEEEKEAKQPPPSAEPPEPKEEGGEEDEGNEGSHSGGVSPSTPVEGED